MANWVQADLDAAPQVAADALEWDSALGSALGTNTSCSKQRLAGTVLRGLMLANSPW